MLFKKGIVALALWTLLLGPTLCGLGVLVHACLGDNAAECHDEVQCSADPCQILVLPAEGQLGRPGDDFDFSDHTPALVLDRAATFDLPPARPQILTASVVLLPASLACTQALPLLC